MNRQGISEESEKLQKGPNWNSSMDKNICNI